MSRQIIIILKKRLVWRIMILFQIIYLIKLMNNNQQLFTQFEQFYRLYLNQKAKNAIPAKLDLKLNLLSKCIKKLKIQESQFPIELEQFKQLRQIDEQQQIILFISIINCISGKEKSLDLIKAYFRKDKYLALWEICYITIDNQMVRIFRKKKQNYNIHDIRVSNQVKKKLGKFAFSIKIEDKKVYIGFSKEEAAVEFLKKIVNFQTKYKNPIETFKKKNFQMNFVTEQIEKKQQKILKDQQLENQIVIESLQKTDISSEKNKWINGNDQDDQQLQEYQQYSDQSIFNGFKLQDLQNDEEFKVFQNFQNGRILYNDKKPNITKISIVIQNSDYQNVLCMFSNIKEWNPDIIKSTFVSKLDNNLFVIYQIHKAFNYNSRPRDFLFLRRAQKIDDYYVIFDKSVSHMNYPQSRTIVRANIIQRITVFVPHPENSNLMLLICRMQIDYRGYNTIEDNRKMGIQYLKKIQFFNAYCIQKSFITLKKTNYINIFNFAPKKKKKVNKIQTLIIKQILKPEIQQPKTQQKKQLKIITKQPIQLVDTIIQQFQLANLMPSYEDDEISQQYINCVKRLQHHLLPLNRFHSQNLRDYFTPKKSIENSKNFIFQNNDWILDSQSQFIFINNRILQIQGSVAKMVLKKLGAHILYGRSLMNISLPVDIFDRRGLLQRSASSFGFAPIYLTSAGKISDHLQQMKILVQFALSLNLLQLSVQKPFNPILGQTFQCYIGNIPIYYQQISHHPPISAFYMKSNQFLIYGNLHSYAQIKFNGGVGGNASPMQIKFGINNSHYQIVIPPGQMIGLLYGQRRFRVVGKAFILNEQKQLFAQVSYGKAKKQLYPTLNAMRKADVAGGIFRVTKDFIQKFKNYQNKHKFEGLSKKDVIQKCSTIQGTWNDTILIDDKIVKTLYDPIPYKIEYEKYPLPSNSNYREDIMYLKMRNIEMAQIGKQKLQNIQRKDKSLRLSTKH